VCRRFRWASVVGRAFSRVMPCNGVRVAVSTAFVWLLHCWARLQGHDPLPGVVAVFLW
jgi:hypothetical protein